MKKTNEIARPVKNHKFAERLKRDYLLYLMLLLPIAFYVIFHYIPMFGIVVAFKDFNIFAGILDSEWVGLGIFEEVFEWKEFYRAVNNTLVLNILSLIVNFPAPIILALLLNEVMNLKLKKGLQTVLYMPHFFSWVIIGGIVYTLFATNTGVINRLLGHIGVGPLPFLTNNTWWIVTYLLTGMWKSAGWGAIIYLAAISGVDVQLYEAAKLDGCSRWKMIWNITLPAIRPTIVVMLILQLGQIMNISFDQPFMMGNAMVSDVSEVISTFVYRIGIQGGQFSIATAVGLFQAVVSLAMIQLSNFAAKKFGDEGIW